MKDDEVQDTVQEEGNKSTENANLILIWTLFINITLMASLSLSSCTQLEARHCVWRFNVMLLITNP